MRIKWPTAHQKEEWQQFNQDVSDILRTISKGDADSRLYTMTTIIISYTSERFGIVQKENKKEPRNNHREKKIHQLRHELKSLKRQYKQANEMEKVPLLELRETLRKNLELFAEQKVTENV